MLVPARPLVYLAIAISVAACAVDKPVETTAQATRPAPTAAEPEREFNMLGAADAPVTIVEFSDLQCPYCAAFERQTFPKLRKAYIDTGKVLYASRDLPLPMHPHAVPAAVAARCAGEQARYWEFRHAVFDAQGRLSAQPYEELARELDLDLERFAACRADGRQLRAVQADARVAAENGIHTTPSFVIGRIVDGQFVGQTHVGVQPFEYFAARIDALIPE
jgi:protein-disulfide isomerase